MEDQELNLDSQEYNSFFRFIDKDFYNLTLNELKEILNYLNLSTHGNKDIQRKRLLIFLKENKEKGLDFVEIVKRNDSLGIDIPKFCKYETL